MSGRTLYAILAGINEYKNPVTPLGGCLNDVAAWQDYLNGESSSFQLNVQILQNQEVTKNAIVSSLQNALTLASVSDVVFFFYSGHGTRESADPVFATIEHDNALESMVCYDSIEDQAGNEVYNLLSDKELHYIISQYGKKGTHIVFVFDCCHSGGMTRNGFSGKDDALHERRYISRQKDNFIAPMRTWEQFIFGANIPKDIISMNGWLASVPQIPHITISACQNDESAYEQSSHGVFTSNLLDVLRRSNGSLSYFDLQSRTRLFTQNQFRQTPEIYTIRNHEEDLMRMFLDKSTPASSLGCTLYYKMNTGWAIDLGAVHGITTYSGPVNISWKENIYSLNILDVFENYSTVELPVELQNLFNQNQGYSASVKNHFSGNTSFYIETTENESDITRSIKASSEKWILDHGVPFSLTDDRVRSSYLITKAADKILICQNDALPRPATEVSMNDSDVEGRVIQYMRHIAQWEYIRNLSNPQFVGDEYPIRMNFYRIHSVHSKQELIARGDTFEFNYDKSSSGEWTGKLKVSITNQSKTIYHCSILYLSNLFRVYGKMIDSGVIGLSPGDIAWIDNGNEIILELEPHIIDFNYEYSIFYLKLMACIHPYQIETLEQSPLPPPNLRQAKGEGGSTSRGIKTRTESAEDKLNWFTRTICFKGRNPFYIPPKLSG